MGTTVAVAVEFLDFVFVFLFFAVVKCHPPKLPAALTLPMRSGVHQQSCNHNLLLTGLGYMHNSHGGYCLNFTAGLWLVVRYQQYLASSQCFQPSVTCGSSAWRGGSREVQWCRVYPIDELSLKPTATPHCQLGPRQHPVSTLECFLQVRCEGPPLSLLFTTACFPSTWLRLRLRLHRQLLFAAGLLFVLNPRAPCRGRRLLGRQRGLRSDPGSPGVRLCRGFRRRCADWRSCL